MIEKLADLGQLQADHPRATGILVAFLLGFAGLQAFRIGYTLAEIRAFHADAARAASEALGG